MYSDAVLLIPVSCRAASGLGGGGLARQEPLLDRWSERKDLCHQTELRISEVLGPQRDPR